MSELTKEMEYYNNENELLLVSFNGNHDTQVGLLTYAVCE